MWTTHALASMPQIPNKPKSRLERKIHPNTSRIMLGRSMSTSRRVIGQLLTSDSTSEIRRLVAEHKKLSLVSFSKSFVNARMASMYRADSFFHRHWCWYCLTARCVTPEAPIDVFPGNHAETQLYRCSEWLLGQSRIGRATIRRGRFSGQMRHRFTRSTDTIWVR